MTSQFSSGIFTERRRDDVDGAPILRSYAAGLSEPTFTPMPDEEIPDHANAGLAVAALLFVAPIISIAGLIWLL